MQTKVVYFFEALRCYKSGAIIGARDNIKAMLAPKNLTASQLDEIYAYFRKIQSLPKPSHKTACIRIIMWELLY